MVVRREEGMCDGVACIKCAGKKEAKEAGETWDRYRLGAGKWS